MRGLMKPPPYSQLRPVQKFNYEFCLGLLLRFNMELDLQSLTGLHANSCTHWLHDTSLPPAFGLIYKGAIGQPR